MAYSLDHLIEREWGDAHTDPVKFEIKCVEKICCEQIYHGKNPCDDGKPFILTQVKRSTNVNKQDRDGCLMEFFRMEHQMVLQSIHIITKNF